MFPPFPGVVMMPLIIQMIALYPARIGFYFLLYPYWRGEALWWSFPVSSIISAALTWLLYTRGNWHPHQSISQMSPAAVAAE